MKKDDLPETLEPQIYLNVIIDVKFRVGSMTESTAADMTNKTVLQFVKEHTPIPFTENSYIPSHELENFNIENENTKKYCISFSPML